ncbi:MAG: NADH-quinone oxidoreductase subunit L [Candidatus Eremiobacteraeota bacterium]|nr:NADH-quinone oxidoreductase subunit L [Candidatus Eremiobacteraeota bacterium]MCW5867379.1 NADH-quinone oxidoreductase subunit L [Candidatus Eremiobacteraeota bacterium]
MELQGSAQYAHWLLLLPLLASGLSAFVTRSVPLLSALLSWSSTLGCLGLSASILAERLDGANPLSYRFINKISLLPHTTQGIANLPVGILIDNLTAVMLTMVCFIALLIQIYSYSYISTEVKHFPTQGPTTVSRFFACLNLFIFSMMGLVLSVSTVQLYIFWELVGLCSYLLIGFWFFKTSAAVASRKAFVVTKFADLGFLLGVLCLGAATQTFLFPTMLTMHLEVSGPLLNIGLILLFCGAIGKSAQFPLHIWLPDAMEGPTPVSALIHAATMVAAGVYMVARMAPVFALPDAHQAAMVVAWTGAITALVAGSLALVQNDIKKILAYSTVSQLGFMLTALGAGATNAGVFHLITHAFFKALLFLGSGAVIVACHSNDIWKMGGLNKRLPATHLAFFFGCLALSGIPPFAGFWSKDEILGGLTHHIPLLAILTFTALLTAFYVGRLYCVAFLGEYRGNREDLTVGGPVPPADLPAPISPAKTIFEMQPFWSEERALQDRRQLPPECLGALSEGMGHGHSEDHGQHQPHEVSPMMYVPLLILSLFAIFLGFAGLPGEHNLFAHFVFPTAEHEAPNYALMAGSVGVALAGFFGAWSMFAARPEEGEARLHKLLGPMLPVLQQKYYMDHLWAKALAYFLYVDAKILSRFDEKAVDGVVYGIGEATYRAGELVRNEQNGQLQRYAITLVVGFFLLTFAMVLFEPQFLWDHLAPFQRYAQQLKVSGGPEL